MGAKNGGSFFYPGDPVRCGDMRSHATINRVKQNQERVKTVLGGKLDATTGNPEFGVPRDDVQNLKGIVMSAVVSSSIDIGCDFEIYVKPH